MVEVPKKAPPVLGEAPKKAPPVLVVSPKKAPPVLPPEEERVAVAFQRTMGELRDRVAVLRMLGCVR